MPPRPLLAAVLPLLLAAGPALAQADSTARSAPAASTGDSSCDAAANAWRACIAASPKPVFDRTLANREVERFVRSVADARGQHRASLTSACPRAAEGYRLMLEQGTCARNVTGARDDSVIKVDASRQGATR